MMKIKEFGLLLGLLSLVILLWVAFLKVGIDLVDQWSIDSVSQLGSSFGAVNALFSGLAFAGLIFTIYLQRKDMDARFNEMIKSNSELEKQVDSYQKMHAVAVYSLRIEALKELIDITEKEAKKNPKKRDYYDNEITKTVKQMMGISEKLLQELKKS